MPRANLMVFRRHGTANILAVFASGSKVTSLGQIQHTGNHTRNGFQTFLLLSHSGDGVKKSLGKMCIRDRVHAQEYFRANGDLNVTRSCCSPDGFRLGEWVANQRERYRRGSMPEQHKKKIESMGMVWERPDSWNTKYAMLESYYKTHGNISIPSTYEENGVWLGPVSYTHLDVYKRQVLPSYSLMVAIRLGCPFVVVL